MPYLLSQLDADGIIDVRATSPNRRGQFLTGWHGHSGRDQTYTDRTLEQPTGWDPGGAARLPHHDVAGLDGNKICDIFDTAEPLWYQRREGRQLALRWCWNARGKEGFESRSPVLRRAVAADP